MPSRNKRNAPSRRQQLSAQPSYSQPQPPDLLSFEPDTVPSTTTYDSQQPAVFELEAPPSDPELGRESTVIRDSRNTELLLAEPVDYAQDMYGPGTSGSDIDDGPVSVSTSPPDPAPIRRYSIAHNAISPPPQGTGRADLSKLAIVEDSTSDDSSLSRSVGHIRSPVLARPRSHHHSDREPTTLESFSRTIRNYVPSSIPIPTAAPSPPRVSRPVSFGSFLTPSTAPSDPVRDRTPSGGMPDTWKRRGSDVGTADPRGRLPWAGQQAYRSADKDQDMPVFSLDDDVPEDGPHEADRRTTRYPGVGDTEEVLWAGWDVLADEEHAKPRSILMLGYPTGLQLWDCSNLGSVAELLNLTGPQWGAVEFAGVLPDPSPQARGGKDAFQQKRPLIAFSSRTVNGTTDFLVYSLRTHEVVKKLPLIGFMSFAASAQFITLSTSNPPTLHVLSSCTLATLYTIPSASLVPFAYPTSSNSSYSQSFTGTKPNIHDVVSPLDIDGSHAHRAHHASPHPIYALSNRLLAYVAPISRHPVGTAQAMTSSGAGHAHTSIPVPPPEATNPLKLGLGMGRGMTQADLGTAAVKIGGSVLSGMKTLGGLAMSAARAGVSAAVAGERDQPAAGLGSKGGNGGLGSMFFSKSAPAATASPHEYQTAQSQRRRSLRMSPPTDILPSSGCNIIVVDLQSLLASSSGKRTNAKVEPEPVAQFTFTRPQALSSLKFSADGTTLAVCSKEGHAIRVLQLRPTPRALRRPIDSLAPSEVEATSKEARRNSTSTTVSSAATEPDEHLAESTQHVYTLRRGRTSAVVEGMEWAHDKLWFGMSTRKRTIHVFAMNPLGGKPDGSSHMAGKVANSQELVSTSTELSPLVRVRLRPLQGDTPSVPCAFTFVRASDIVLPASLLPPASVHFSASSSPSSVQSGTGLSKPVSPAQRPTRPTNYKDLLVFDPTDGTLTLRRIFVVGSIPVPGGMSISLPGMSTLSRSMGASPPSANSGLGVSPRKVSGLTQMMERGTDITGRESVVGTWSLARGRDWPEVKPVVKAAKLGGERPGRLTKSDWLSRAELSTFSTSPRVLPRLIYLSHQFAFHVLGEDYHALIRSAHLDVPSTKIEVRKPVEVSAFATGDSEAFVQGLSSSHVHGIGGMPSSFDEPLASALSAPLHPLNPSPPVLPMLPNGIPGSSSASRSFIKHAIPIRHVAAGISDGMSEGLGRIRRELGRARAAQSQTQSPRLNSGSDPVAVPSVPLEFDEEDEMEDFARHAVDLAETDAYTEADVISRSTSMGDPVHGGTSAGSGASVSVSTPSTNIEPLPEEHDGEQVWQGWSPEDKQAVEDAERFDDITVGFLDEEQETMRAASAAVASAAAEANAKGRKRRGARRH
ncbi:hypothetical protein GY45DRAFT_1344085 [Cubamyces sp. BRFM 1775]|nr:hypothetical protein GY45DRAFT_1344085 [Cubamyces sp. BRFM 1775]